jgi:hypothetical protein
MWDQRSRERREYRSGVWQGGKAGEILCLRWNGSVLEVGDADTAIAEDGDRRVLAQNNRFAWLLAVAVYIFQRGKRGSTIERVSYHQ